MPDKLLEMETFVRVVEAGTLSAAAEQLAVAKSAVSKRLTDLEARLGVQLLARTTRSLNLTDSGRSFLVQAKDILSAVEIAESDFASGNLMRTSYARPGKLFSANTSLMQRVAGNLAQPKLTAVVDAVVALLRPKT